MSLEDYVREHISSLRQELRDWTRETVRGWVANLLTSTTYARVSESDDDPLRHDAQGFASADGYSASNAESGEAARPKVRHMEAPCFAFVPLEKEPLKTVGIGSNLLGFGVASERYRPKGVKKGEFAVYNLRAGAQQLVIRGDQDSACTITVGSFLHIEVDKNGRVKLAAKDGQQVRIDSGAGADIVLNGGTLRVARVTDPVAASTEMGLWMNAVDAAIKALSLGDPVTLPGGGPTTIGTIDSAGGAEHTKA
jgi:hypothetical protein